MFISQIKFCTTFQQINLNIEIYILSTFYLTEIKEHCIIDKNIIKLFTHQHLTRND